MFKVGDIVRVNNTFPGYKGEKFRITKIYYSDTHLGDMFVIIHLNKGYERHFLSENLKYDKLYDRKKKINKICSKLEIL